jgi:hypothetical protein
MLDALYHERLKAEDDLSRLMLAGKPKAIHNVVEGFEKPGLSLCALALRSTGLPPPKPAPHNQRPPTPTQWSRVFDSAALQRLLESIVPESASALRVSLPIPTPPLRDPHNKA